MSEKPPKRKRLRLTGHDYAAPGYAYSLTICARRGTHPFGGQELAAQAVVALRSMQSFTGVRIIGYCIMPDHVHVVCWLPENAASIPSFVRRFKSLVSRAARELGQVGSLWQRSYYDHVIRRSEDVRQVCAYVIANPVRRGLAEQVGDYPFAGFLGIP
jgi:REP element-mobilizing transposase RayT